MLKYNYYIIIIKINYFLWLVLKLVLSKYFHSIPVGFNQYAVFNSLIMDVIYVSERELQIITSPNEDDNVFSTQMKAIGVWVNNHDVDKAALQLLRSEYKASQKKIEILYLIVTQGCNLGCKYCFLENEYANWSVQMMSWKTAKIAIDKFIDYIKVNSITKPLIVFFGGEPLLNWGIIHQVVIYCEHYNSKSNEDARIRFSIITNGTMLNDDIAEFLHNYNIGTAISIDGPKELNDKNRVYKSSPKSVYDSVQKNINILIEHKCSFGLSLTLSPELLICKEHLVPWLKEMNVANIFTNLFHYSKNDNNWKDHYKASASLITDQFIQLYDARIYNGRPIRQAESIISGRFKFSDCAGVGLNQLSIKPDGEIRVCQCDYESSDNHLGNILYDNIEELLSLDNSRWINKTPIMRDECQHCEALFCCGGGCITQSRILFTNEQIDYSYCIYAKHILKWILEKNYNEEDKQ